MLKLLLTSNGFYTEAIKNQFIKLVDGEISELKVAIITTASSEKKIIGLHKKAKRDFQELGFQYNDYIDLEFDNPEILSHKDVIYINVGNLFKLLFHTKQCGANKILRKLVSRNMVVVGVSAGAVLLGPNINVVQFFTPQMNTQNTVDLSALELTDKLIFPHYDREDLFKDNKGKSIEDRLKEFEAFEKCEVSRLKDEEFITIKK